VRFSWPYHMRCLWIVRLLYPTLLVRWTISSGCRLSWYHWKWIQSRQVCSCAFSERAISLNVRCRDWLIGNITGSPIPTQNLTNTSTYTGTTTWAGYTYQSIIKYTGGLLSNTSYGINHNWSVPVNGINAADGLVAVIEIKLTGTPPSHKSYVISSFPPFTSLK